MKIKFVNGSRAGDKIELMPEGVKIGRETDNDISILEAGLSRYHATIEKRDDIWIITDLNSTNGVKINGNRIKEPAPLKSGDEIKMGSQLFYCIVDGEGSSKLDIAPPEPLNDGKGSFSFDKTVKPPEPLSTVGDDNSLIKPPEPLTDDKKDTSPKPVDDAGVAAKPQDQSTSGASPFNFNLPDPLENDNADKAVDGSEQKVSEERKEEIKSFFEAFSKNEQQDSKAGQETSFNNNDWFSGKKADGSGDDTSAKPKSRRAGNLIFYVAVIAIAIIFVSIYVKFIEEPPVNSKKATEKKGLTQQQKKQKQIKNFVLVYKKQIFSKDNIFRYYLKIENGKAVVELDDLKHKRRFTEPIKELRQDQIELLMDAMRETGFMALTQDADGLAVDDKEVSRSLTVGYDGDIKTIIVKNKFAPSSFEKIESIIEEFSRDFLGAPLVLTVEEMRAYAESAFDKAEQLYMNRDARPENLNEAIKRYKIVMEQLDTFSPKPKIWDTSRKRVAEAKVILDKQVKDHMFNALHAYKMKNYNTSRQEFAAVMDMLDASDKRYQKARGYVNQLDDHLKRQKKFKRK